MELNFNSIRNLHTYQKNLMDIEMFRGGLHLIYDLGTTVGAKVDRMKL